MTSSRFRQMLTEIMLIGWPLIVFIGYVYIHKPFANEQLQGILLALWQILVMAAILSLAGGIGMLTQLRDLPVPALTRTMLTAAFGLGVISIAVLLIGTAIGINLFLAILFAVGMILLRKQIVLWWKDWLEITNRYRGAGKLGKIIFFLTIVILLCQLIIALAPPLQFDTLTYHLTIPKEYVQLQKLMYLPDNMEWGMARQAEILYTLAMFMGSGAETATVLCWAIGILTLIGLLDYAGAVFGTDAGWVAVASLICGMTLSSLLSSGYNDWTTMFYGLAMFICILQLSPETGFAPITFAGLFAGMAVATKYTAGVALASGALAILFFGRSASMRKTLSNLALFGGMALVASLPWGLRNFLATSNPFYPVLIPGGAMDQIRLNFYQLEQTRQDWSRLLLLPWQITVWGIEGYVGYAASIGPLLLSLSPFAFINWQGYSQQQRRVVAGGTIVVISTFLGWAIVSQFSGNLEQTRYYLPNFPAWALLCAAGYFATSSIKLNLIRAKVILGTFVLLALGLNTYSNLVTILATDPLQTILGIEPRQAYIEKNLSGYGPAMEMLNALPENAHVLMLWETRGFECVPKCDSDEIIDRWYHDWHTYQGSAAVINSWKSQGYTHVMLNRWGAGFIKKNDSSFPGGPDYWTGLEATLHLLKFEKSVANGAYELYSIPYP